MGTRYERIDPYREETIFKRGAMERLHVVDPEVAAAIEDERLRQTGTIELNAATNFPDPAVMEASGSVFALKTLEGYPGNRYHGGYGSVDVIETLAVDRAKRLFGAEHANVQPHCGVNANLAVYVATLIPGDPILGMDLATGGHLSHGYRASFSGKFFNASSYGIDRQNELIDYDAVRTVALRETPKMIICGASSYPRVIDFKAFREIADETGAYLLADIAHVAGLVAGGAYPSPVPFADFVTFTTYKTLRGGRGGVILCKGRYARRIDNAVFPGSQGSMHVHHMAGKAVTFKLASNPSFKAYSRQVVANGRALASALRDLKYRIVCGGTDTHIVLVDLTPKDMTGVRAQELLEETGIICNKNAIPFDPLGPEKASGIRLGTSAATSRGFREPEMALIAEMIDGILTGSSRPEGVKEKVKELCNRFPVHPDLHGGQRGSGSR